MKRKFFSGTPLRQNPTSALRGVAERAENTPPKLRTKGAGSKRHTKRFWLQGKTLQLKKEENQENERPSLPEKIMPAYIVSFEALMGPRGIELLWALDRYIKLVDPAFHDGNLMGFPFYVVVWIPFLEGMKEECVRRVNCVEALFESAEIGLEEGPWYSLITPILADDEDPFDTALGCEDYDYLRQGLAVHTAVLSPYELANEPSTLTKAALEARLSDNAYPETDFENKDREVVECSVGHVIASTCSGHA